ncbi:MAG: hypothetical protein IJS67_00575, partial [Clostridia bacterium]|nr:hypothetical protein [Clostridia bacterium]
SFKEEITQKVKTEIFFLVDEYNQELRSLSSVFGIEESEPELPFDGDAVRLDLPIFGYGDELFSDDDQSTFIKSENFSGVKN